MRMLLIYQLLAQAPVTPEVLKQFADEASQKDFRWWFAIIFGILMMSGTVVFRMLLKQISEQRTTNSELNKDFITNMKEDRLKIMLLLERTTIVLEKLEEDKKLQLLLQQQSINPTLQNERRLQQHQEKTL